MIYFTSDLHFSHANIIRYADRPFRDTNHMDEEIIRRWNATVGAEDTVYVLGDVALGPIDKSLPKVARLNGHKICVLGNHDRPFMNMDNPVKMNEWLARYHEVFQDVLHWAGDFVVLDGKVFVVSHFPYTGDHTPTDRHAEHRMQDNGIPLIHGHIHTRDKLTFSSRGTPQIHVGVDAHDFYPVSSDEILALMP